MGGLKKHGTWMRKCSLYFLIITFLKIDFNYKLYYKKYYSYAKNDHSSNNLSPFRVIVRNSVMDYFYLRKIVQLVVSYNTNISD